MWRRRPLFLPEVGKGTLPSSLKSKVKRRLSMEASKTHKHRRVSSELVRLLVGALRFLGHGDIASRLSETEGTDNDPPEVTALRSSVESGNWDAAISIWPQLQFSSEDASLAARLVLDRQRVTELVVAGKATAAVQYLREASPLSSDMITELCVLAIRGPESGKVPTRSDAAAEIISGLAPGVCISSDELLKAVSEQQAYNLYDAELKGHKAREFPDAKMYITQALIDLGHLDLVSGINDGPLFIEDETNLRRLCEDGKYEDAAIAEFELRGDLSPELLAAHESPMKALSTLRKLPINSPELVQAALKAPQEFAWKSVYASELSCERMLANATKWRVATDKYWCGEIPEQLPRVPASSRSFPHHHTIHMRYPSAVWVVEFSKCGNYLAVGCESGSIYISRLEDGLPISDEREERGLHHGGVSVMSWNPKEPIILTGGLDSYVNLYDARIGRKLLNLHDFDEGMGAVTWMPDGKHFFAGGFNGRLIMYDLSGTKIWSYDGVRVRSLAVSNGGTRLVVLSAHEPQQQRLLVFDIKDWRFIEERRVASHLASLHVTENDASTYCAVGRNVVYVGNFNSESPMLRLKGPKQRDFTINARFCGPLNKYVAVGSEESTHEPAAWIFNRFTGELTAKLEGHSNMVNSVTWCPNHPVIATGSDDETVILWTAENGAS